MPDRLYIIVDRKLSTGLACAQTAHAATVAANKWNITHETYIIVLASSEDLSLEDIVWCCGDECVFFEEPDLDNAITAVAILNPAPSFTQQFALWTEGGEKNGN